MPKTGEAAMTNLPATLIEAEAERVVRKWLDQCRAEDCLDIGISMVDPKAGHIHLRQILKFLAMSPIDPLKIIEVIDWAESGWQDAEQAMLELAVDLEDRGEPVPVALKAFRNRLAYRYLRGQQPPHAHGALKATHILQDIVICAFVEKLTVLFPTLAVFSRSARKACICGIVAMVFTEAKLGRILTAEGVRKIRKRLGDDPRHFKGLLVEKLGA
jgi:hypothetical protein